MLIVSKLQCLEYQTNFEIYCKNRSCVKLNKVLNLLILSFCKLVISS